MKNVFLLLLLTFLSVSLVSQSQQDVDSLEIYLKKHQFNKALLWIENQDKTKSNEFQKAMCYKVLGDNRKATLILEELAKEYPNDIAVKTELATIYEQASKWRSSANVYADLMSMDTANVYFPIKRAESNLNLKDTDGAIKDLNNVLEKDSLRSAIFFLGKSYETANKLDTASYYYQIGWQRDSTDVTFATNFVNTFIKQRDFTKSLINAKKYMDIDSTSHQMNFLYGYSLYGLEQYEQSAEVLQKCYNLGDSSLVLTRALGMSYYFMGESENSYKYLKKAFVEDTTHNVVLHHLAISASDIKKYDESTGYFTKLLHRLIPSDMQLYLNYRGLAIAYEEQEKYFEAAQCYEKAIEYATQEQTFYMLEPLAHMYLEHLDRENDAIHYYRMYRSLLDGRLLSLKHDTSEEDHTEAMEDISKQIAELDSFIREQEQEHEQKKEKVVVEYPILFVVNGGIVDLPPKGKPNMTKTIYNLEKATEEDLQYVEIAKEKGKTSIVIIDMDLEEESVEAREVGSTD